MCSANQMNRTTKRVMTGLLQKEEYWDNKTRELYYAKLLEDYRHAREALFYDEIFFPRMMRAMRLIRSMGIVPDWAWDDEATVGYFVEITGPWVIDPAWTDCIQSQFCGEIFFTRTGKTRATYFSRWWQDEDWAYEEPTLDDLMALGILPTMVPSKTMKDGSVQEALF